VAAQAATRPSESKHSCSGGSWLVEGCRYYGADYELWYGRKPSLSHLREIGCRAFALIPTNNPKINHRSLPCILIGYAPNAKAYRLWDASNDRIFNSYHVSFIEQREHPPMTISSQPHSISIPSTSTSSTSATVHPLPSRPPVFVPQPQGSDEGVRTRDELKPW
jgi:hypothetical protein